MATSSRLNRRLACYRMPTRRNARRRRRPLRRTFKKNVRTFSLITNTLAKDKDISDRWRGFVDVADARHLSNRVEREVVDALVSAVQAAYPKLSHRYYALKAKWFGKERLPHWDRKRAASGSEDAHDPMAGSARDGAVGLWCVLADDGEDRGAVFRRSLDRRAGAPRARRRARSRIRLCRPRTLTCCSIIRANRAT